MAGLAATVRIEGQDAGGGDHGTRQGRRPRPAQGGSAGESKRERPGRAVEKDTEQGRDVTIVDIDPWGAFFEDFWGQAEGGGADRPDGGREPARDARAKGVEGFHPYDLVQANSPEEWQALHDLRRTELFARMEGVAYDADHPDDRAPTHFPLVLKFRDRHIGTARLDLFENGGAAIRLVAIAREEQRKGHGRVLEQLLEELARSKGVSKLFMNAHPTAVGYYERLGFIHEEWREPGGVRSSIAKDCVLMTKVI